jgi:hypothetical protein
MSKKRQFPEAATQADLTYLTFGGQTTVARFSRFFSNALDFPKSI